MFDLRKFDRVRAVSEKKYLAKSQHLADHKTGVTFSFHLCNLVIAPNETHWHRDRAHDPSSHSNLASDHPRGSLSGWNFFAPETAATETAALPVLSFSDTDFSHLMFNQLMNSTGDFPTPPSINCAVEDENILKVKFQEA